MVSKNNKKELFCKQVNQAKRYTLKKLSVGVASVAIGVIAFLSHSQSVSADELTSNEMSELTQENLVRSRVFSNPDDVAEENLGDYYVRSKYSGEAIVKDFDEKSLSQNSMITVV